MLKRKFEEIAAAVAQCQISEDVASCGAVIDGRLTVCCVVVKDADEMLYKFLGRDPKPDAFLLSKGLQIEAQSCL